MLFQLVCLDVKKKISNELRFNKLVSRKTFFFLNFITYFKVRFFLDSTRAQTAHEKRVINSLFRQLICHGDSILIYMELEVVHK